MKVLFTCPGNRNPAREYGVMSNVLGNNMNDNIYSEYNYPYFSPGSWNWILNFKRGHRGFEERPVYFTPKHTCIC